MNFINRLKYYLIGVGLGILMVMAIFKDRNLRSWMPQFQVIKEISEKPLGISEEIMCRFECTGLSTENEIDSILATGDVDFKRSNVKAHDAREYIINIEDHAIEEIRIIIYSEKIVVVSVIVPNIDCHCL